jgi:ubiquinone/menaquinone biosynthesis C-methylase UbiE
MHVADIGAGTGFLSFMIAEQVGVKGRVYAVDIARNFVDNLLRRAKQQGLTQIVGWFFKYLTFFGFNWFLVFPLHSKNIWAKKLV